MFRITEKMGTIILKGQRCCTLEPEEGNLTVRIRMMAGNIRVNHCCYTPDGGTWLSGPDGGRNAHYDISEGEETFLNFDIRKSFGKSDRIDIVNSSLFRKCSFEYELIKNGF